MKATKYFACFLAVSAILSGCGKADANEPEGRKVSAYQDALFRLERQTLEGGERLQPPNSLEGVYEFAEQNNSWWKGVFLKVKLLSENEFHNIKGLTLIESEVLAVPEFPGSVNEYDLKAGDTVYLVDIRYVVDDILWIDDWVAPYLDCYDYFVYATSFMCNGLVDENESRQQHYEEAYPEETARYAALKDELIIRQGVSVMFAIPVTDDVDEYFDLLRSYEFNVERRNQGLTAEELKTYYEEINRLYG